MPDDEASLGAEHIENTHPGVLTSEQPTLNVTEERGRSSPPPKVTGISKKSRPASTSTPLKDNPFIRADRKMKTAVAEPQITDIAARAGQASRLSDCVPKQADLSIVDTHGDYENHRCNATHAAHHSDLNNVVCMMEQQVPVGNRGDSDQLIQHLSLADPVQDKIDKMYHHAEDLKRAQHIMEHLAAGSIPTKGGTQVSQDKILKATRASTPSMENLLSQAGGFGLNREKLVSLDMTMAEDRKYTRAKKVHDLERSRSFDVDPVKKKSSDSTQARSRLASIETENTPQMNGSNRNHSAAMPSLGPETHSPPASAASLQSTKSSSQPSQSQITQYGSPTSQEKIQWPKLKKVVPKTTLEASKEPLPWMRKPLRRVQKEEDMSLQVREQKSADVESWRSQLRKTQALDKDSPGERQGEDGNHGDHKRAETCLTCCHEAPSPSPSLVNALKTTPDIATQAPEVTDDTVQQEQNEPSHRLKQKGLEEIRISGSSRSTSQSLQLTKMEPDTITHVSQTSETVLPKLKSVSAKETRVDSVEQVSVEPPRSCTSEVEVFSPMPIMPPNHACSWKERYLNLTAEVRQLKAEIVSQEQHNSSGRVDIETNVSQGDNDLGVEGLTIVMHLKGKDDLIINTDLTRASYDV